MNRLSHSSTRLFMECAQKYKYHYIDKLRPKLMKSALLFGTAIDRGVDSLLKGEEGKKPEQLFQYFWNFQDVNGKNEYLANHPELIYSDSDFDKDLLLEEDWDKLKELYNVDQVTIEEIRTRKNAVSWDILDTESKVVHNHANWLCLKRKGLLMIQAIREDFLPMCEEILATQVACELTNEEGDKVVGYADIVAKVKGYDKPIVLDLKTSARDYASDSVITSPQLTLYVHALSDKYEHTRLAGYVVLSKQIQKNKKKVCSTCGHNGTGRNHKTCDNIIEGKRCGSPWNETVDPKAKVQVIIDPIPEQTEHIIIENIDYINQSIKNGVFHRNFQSCNLAYGPCPYLKKCFRNDDTGLFKS